VESRIERVDSGGPNAEFLDAMRARGATNPRRACSPSELPRITRSRLQALLDDGIVRECADGALYVYDRPIPVTRIGGRVFPSRRRFVFALVFWIVATIVPIVIINLLQ
jgi:hypothetical protein